jgi:hypothetical protein
MATLNFKQIVDFFKNEIRNAVLHKVSGAPSTPVEGQIWYDTTGKRLNFQSDVGAIDPTARANHSGTQVASTISDFNTAVRSNTLNQMATPTADLPMGTHKLTGLAAGTTSGDAVEFNQMNAAVAAAVAGTSWKTPVEAATTANVANLTTGAPSSLDGVSLTAGMRILVKNQTTTSQNGIYTVTTVGTGTNGVWARATDMAAASTVAGGTLVSVDQGVSQADTAWMVAADVNSVGTDAMSWIPFGVGSSYIAGAGLTLSGSTFNVGAGTGIVVNADDVALAPSVVRKSLTGVVGTTAADITVNHAFALANKEDLIVQVWEVGVGLVMCGVVPVDANNVTLSFASTPTSNQYRYSMIGLS